MTNSTTDFAYSTCHSSPFVVLLSPTKTMTNTINIMRTSTLSHCTEEHKQIHINEANAHLIEASDQTHPLAPNHLQSLVSQPALLHDTRRLISILQSDSAEDLMKRMRINFSLAKLNAQRFASFSDDGIIPAILSYQGLQYQQLEAASIAKYHHLYVQQHFRILSGLYGVLRPFDLISPYRLDLLTKITIGDAKNLYQFWGNRCYQQITDVSRTILNLSSKEYTQLIKPFLQPEDCFIEIMFLVEKAGVRRVEATASKMARGRMARWIGEKEIKYPRQLKDFTDDCFVFDEVSSSDSEFVFVSKRT